MNRKYKQITSYSKIMKKRRQTGQYEQIVLNQQPNQMQNEQKNPYQPQAQPDGEWEDDFQDVYEEEQAWVSDSQSDNQQQEDQNTIQSQQEQVKKQNTYNNAHKKQKAEVFTGTNKNLKKGQVLQFDNNAYDMLHRLNNQWPSLSIDFVCHDSPFLSNPVVFQKMTKYPYQVYTVQGSSNNTQNNSVYLTKWSKLHKTKYDDDPDVQGDSEDEDIANDEQPEVIVQQVQTTYSINRIRSLINSPIVAFWNDQGQIHIMDLTKNFQKLKNNIGTKKNEIARQIILHSESEGFALCWNHHKIGQLATGNMQGHIQIFQNNQNYSSWQKSSLYDYHKGSIEDIVYSPNQATAFASCSSDGTLQIVDMRVGDFKKSQIMIKAHDKDVNVCDWNRINHSLIVTGSDDGSVKVWDLRKCKQKNRTQQLLSFKWHSEPITSIKFQPNQQSVIALASQDNSVSFWDMSMQNQQEDPQIPNQLMFIHQGQEQIKQICFHPIYYEMVVSSAMDGINLFKPSYQMPEQENDEKQDLKRPPIKEQDLDLYLNRMNKKHT